MGKHLQQDGMLNAAINDMGLGHSTRQGLFATTHLGDHAADDGLVIDQGLDFCPDQGMNQRPLPILDPGHIGEQDQLGRLQHPPGQSPE